MSGRDVAGAGLAMLLVNCLCAGVGALIGWALGRIIPFAIAGFFVGFGLAIWFVIKRFGD